MSEQPIMQDDRMVYSAADRDGWVPMTDGSLYVDDGFLDAEGNTDAGHGLSCSLSGPGGPGSTGTIEDADRIQALWQECLDRVGTVARYTDFLDASRFTRFAAVVGAICAVAATCLTVGWVRVRRRVL